MVKLERKQTNFVLKSRRRPDPQETRSDFGIRFSARFCIVGTKHVNTLHIILTYFMIVIIIIIIFFNPKWF